MSIPLNLVYLRPEQPGTPVDYIRSVEKAGLVTLPQKYLAMYTMGGNPSVGPAGPQGPAGMPYLNDTIIASCSDEYTPLQVDLVNPATTYRAPFPQVCQYIRCSLTTAPTGADVIVDVHMNGVSMFTGGNLLHIDAGSKTSVGSATPYVLAITAVPDDAEFEIFITQVGSTVAGSGLKISITGEKQDLT